jgi:hypothetical protein
MRTGFWLFLALAACGVPADEPTVTSDCADSAKVDAWTDADGDGAGDATTRASVCQLAADQVDNGDDCDDANADISPSAAEACDGVDQDCDGVVDNGLATSTWYTDSDEDGFGDPTTGVDACAQPPGAIADSTDCDDTSADISPSAIEICDGVDNNCDTFADDDDGGVDPASETTFYRDRDRDGFGDDAAVVQACVNPDAAHYQTVGGDCDDADVQVFPGQVEICNSIDDNCDTLVDEDDPLLDPAMLDTFYVDADQDGVGDESQPVQGCFRGPGQADTFGDCDDGDPALGAPQLWVLDADADGVGAGAPLGPESCFAPQPDAVPQTLPEDCADADPLVYPGAVDTCADGIDQDCSGLDAACGPIGSYFVSDGPIWGTNPPVYSCLEACALVFGGASTDYHCSTSALVEDFQAYESGYADAAFCTTPVPEDFSKGAGGYDCGVFGCSYSAYVQDNCFAPGAENFCWPR